MRIAPCPRCESAPLLNGKTQSKAPIQKIIHTQEQFLSEKCFKNAQIVFMAAGWSVWINRL
jgi:hypothetical protein